MIPAVTTLVLSLLSAAAAPGGAPGCGPAAGTCCEPNPTPGCDVRACCDVVCASDAFCCEVEWDPSCAEAALEACVGLPRFTCGNPACGTGACDEPNGTPGCDDIDCCTEVCGCDPYCCEVEWDAFCAGPNGAVPGCSWLELCQAGEACTDLACKPGDAAEGEACGTDGNGGCNSTPRVFGAAPCGAAICGTAWADRGTRDTDWYEIATITTCTEITATLVSEFAGVVFIVDGMSGCAPVVIGAPGTSFACAPIAPAAAQVDPGVYAVFVATGGFSGYPCAGDRVSYRLTVGCASCDRDPEPCPADTDGDGGVGVSDLVNLITLWGTDGQVPGIDADVDDDGVVAVGDLAAVLVSWGACP